MSRTRSSSPAFETFRGVVEVDVAEAAGPEQPLLAVDLEARRPAVHEVELVLEVVVVEEALLARRIDDGVDAERRHLERRPDLPEAVPVAELVDRAEAVSHGVPPG